MCGALVGRQVNGRSVRAITNVKGIMRTVVVILGLSAGVTGCRGSESIAGSPVTPSAPSGSQPQITAIGGINAAPCTNSWWADKR